MQLLDWKCSYQYEMFPSFGKSDSTRGAALLASVSSVVVVFAAAVDAVAEGIGVWI